MRTVADRIIAFYENLQLNVALPPGISVMKPLKDDGFTEAKAVSTAFFKKFFNDTKQRSAVVGINPGRFGGGVTGVPFTDPKRIAIDCGIPFPGKITHEPSSAFIYEMIGAFGGAEKFYRNFYITAVCPLGFTQKKENGREVNYNYYDDPALTRSVKDFIVTSLEKQLPFLQKDICICIGTGKNEKFLRALNDEKRWFKTIIAVEHPRFIMQYRAKEKQFFIEKYLAALHQAAS